MNKIDIAHEVRALRLKRQHLADAADVTLAASGLNIAQLLEHVDRVSGGSSSAAARSVGRLYHLHGWPVKEISLMSGLPESRVQVLLDSSPRSQATQRVMELHGRGLTPAQITEETGIHRGQVYRWLEEAGLTPHRQSQKFSHEQRKRIVELYEAGNSYSEIALVMKLGRSQVIGIVRTAAARGECPNYGARA